MNTDTKVNEIWRIPDGFPKFKVSNQGNILKNINGQWNSFALSIDANGYSRTSYKGRTIYIHQLVAMAFLNHKPNGMTNVVDHINGNIKDNRVENLRITSIRENANNRHHKKSSQFIGVNWHKRSKKWQSKIKYQGKQYTLGMFDDEKEAALAYQSAKTILQKIV